ncbi:MAG TPA: hypothetical protein VK066_08045 [Chloroflexota bacterium]|nr:hypothetical protein [Chloroflexota bacterium]
MATGSTADPYRVVESPLDSMRDRVEVAAAFQRWLQENGHTDRGHCPGCAAYYGHHDES